jgi:ATP-dependent exoDNAse (exonuclease V) beta subunit
VHKAKGLEFPIVIVGDTSWNQKASTESLLFNKDEDGICFTLNCDDDESAETFLSKLEAEEQDRDLEEEKRSLYVATTRASDMLILTFSGQKGKKSQPWNGMIVGNMLEVNESGAKASAGFKHLIDIVTAPEGTVASKSEASQNVCLDTRYIDPVASETFKEYVSPTAIIEASMLGWSYDFEHDNVFTEVDRNKSQARGLIAHHIMKAVENGSKLEDVLNSGNLVLPQEIKNGQEDLEVVCKYLILLKDHPLVIEMENASDSKNEYEITKPFGKHILYGRLDKLIKTPDGWKILDFKFSRSEQHKEAHEFQMKFYLYLARDIFSPLLGAELFYLKDGISILVTPSEEDIPNFISDLEKKIDEHQHDSRQIQNNEDPM